MLCESFTVASPLHNSLSFSLHSMGRPPCCDKSNVRRGLWSAEEDAKLLAFVSNHGVGNWTEVPKKAGLNRCGKSCRLRWTNYLRPDLKHDGFTPHEEELIIYLHKLVGSRWSLIAKHLPGRTDNDVKNCWNTKLRKKLQKMGIDPITHRPISQVLLDYGNISTGLPTSRDPFDFLTTPSLSASKQEQPTINPAMPRNNTANCSLSSDSFALMDPLPQFQVTCQGNIQAQVTYSCSSSSSSSTPLSLRPLSSPQSSSWRPFQAKPPSHSNSFSWNQFLICDQDEGQDFSAMSSSDSSLTDANANNLHKSGNMERCESLAHDAEQGTTTTTGADHSSSPGTSFIDSILDKDGEMRSQFPQLLDSSFDYF